MSGSKAFGKIMTTGALFIFALVFPFTLLAVPEIPIRAETGLSQEQLQRIYLSIENLSDGIAILEQLDQASWFTELGYEGSAVSHPYIRYKEEKDRLMEGYSLMDSRQFKAHLALFQTKTLAAYHRGLEEKERISKLIKIEPNQSLVPTTMPVTSDACASAAPATVAAHF